jgi:hypothetical protein
MSSIDENRKKTVIRSTRYSPALIGMINTECALRRVDFSNYIRYAAMTAMKHNKISDRSEAATEYDKPAEPQQEWFAGWRDGLCR